ADYARMWLQAAMTMATYQVTATTAMASTSRTAPAPPVLAPGAEAAAAGANVMSAQATPMAAESGSSLDLSNIITDLLNGYMELIKGLYQSIIDLLTNPDQLLEFLLNPFSNFPLLFLIGYQVFFNLVGWPTWAMILSAPLVLPLVLGLGIGAVLEPVGVDTPAEDVPADQSSQPESVVPRQDAPPLAAPAAPVTAAAGAAAATSPAPPPPAAPAVPVTGAEAIGYVVRGEDWGHPIGPNLIDRTGATAPAARIPAAAAGLRAMTREQARTRRRQRKQMKDFGDEYMDMNGRHGGPDTPDPSAVASRRGAGRLGFNGTAVKAAVAPAAGLTTLSTDEFGEHPAVPMMPGTWGEHPEPPTDTAGGGNDN
ncbi:MAG TPA: PPE family protein, partial [Mycobacterium sp.]|nr:PPE family protein [Mycobacterium sp.]